MSAPPRRAYAAAVTPLRRGGSEFDADAVAPYVDYLKRGGLDGVLALGTTGECMLFSAAERRAIAERFVGECRGRLDVIVHCGAQSTADTEALCAHAKAIGAPGVAVIGPPYFVLDEAAQLAHFEAAARACDPVPFYLYEFAKVSGYAVAPTTIAELKRRRPNLRGLKCSDAPFDKLEPYLLPELDVYVGAEALLHRAIERGARGAVSGLAAAFPDVVARHVASPTAADSERIAALRASLQAYPFQAAQKYVLSLRGVPVRRDVRGPLRRLSAAEESELQRTIEPWLRS